MNKLALALSVTLLLPLSSAFAETGAQANIGVSLHGDAHAGQWSDDEGKAEVETSTKIIRIDDGPSIMGTTSAEARLHASTTAKDDSAAEHHEADVSANHRSAVAAFVQKLLHVADRDGGIGAKVRAVAQSQNESASTTAEAIARVEARNAFLSFLIGSDWKNIGTLRSEIAKTSGDAARLQAAISSTTDASVKADLEAQLHALQTEKARVETFVEAHEKSFSLFGWFTKLFVKGSATTTASTTAQ
jgi:hypothetical protein